MHVILHERFRKNVASVLAARGWSKSELARRMGVANPYVFQYLRQSGKPSPGLDVIEKFAAALEVDPSDLLAEEIPTAAA